MCLSELLEQFEIMRKEMIEYGIKYGLKHPKVLHKSEELDKLHIQIINLQKDKTSSSRAHQTQK